MNNWIELLEKISEAAAQNKNTEVLVLLPKLQELITKLEEEKIDNGMMSADEKQENASLHQRLGDKPICDKHGCEVTFTDCAVICDKCELERPEEEKKADNYFPGIAKYHWEEYDPFPTSKVVLKARYEGGYDTLKMVDHQWAGDCASCGKVWSTQDTMGCDKEEVKIGKFKFKVFIGACCNPRFDKKTNKYKWEIINALRAEKLCQNNL